MWESVACLDMAKEIPYPKRWHLAPTPRRRAQDQLGWKETGGMESGQLNAVRLCVDTADVVGGENRQGVRWAFQGAYGQRDVMGAGGALGESAPLVGMSGCERVWASERERAQWADTQHPTAPQGLPHLPATPCKLGRTCVTCAPSVPKLGKSSVCPSLCPSTAMVSTRWDGATSSLQVPE